HQHGTAASGHARRAARHLEARRRKSSRHRVRHRIPAPRRGKNRREPHLHDVQSLRRQDGLLRRRLKWAGVLRSGREVDECGGCAARLTTHAFRIGACQYETYAGFEKEVKNFLTFFAPKIDEYEALLPTNRIWLERTKNVGVISAADCVALGVTGPVLRASGVRWDLRKAQPYAAYSNFDFEIPIGTNGDTYDRYLVR